MNFLKDFKEYVYSDGYSGYNKLSSSEKHNKSVKIKIPTGGKNKIPTGEKNEIPTGEKNKIPTSEKNKIPTDEKNRNHII